MYSDNTTIASLMKRLGTSILFFPMNPNFIHTENHFERNSQRFISIILRPPLSEDKFPNLPTSAHLSRIGIL